MTEIEIDLLLNLLQIVVISIFQIHVCDESKQLKEVCGARGENVLGFNYLFLNVLIIKRIKHLEYEESG